MNTSVDIQKRNTELRYMGKRVVRVAARSKRGGGLLAIGDYSQ